MILRIPASIRDKIMAYVKISPASNVSGAGIIDMDDDTMVVTEVFLLKQALLRPNKKGSITKLTEDNLFEYSSNLSGNTDKVRVYWTTSQDEVLNFNDQSWFVILRIRDDDRIDAYLVQGRLQTQLSVEIDYTYDADMCVLYENQISSAFGNY